jgi:hypothetical protein
MLEIGGGGGFFPRHQLWLVQLNLQQNCTS